MTKIEKAQKNDLALADGIEYVFKNGLWVEKNKMSKFEALIIFPTPLVFLFGYIRLGIIKLLNRRGK